MRRIRGVRHLRDIARSPARTWPGTGLDVDLRLLWQTALALLALSVVIGIIAGQQRLFGIALNVSATHTHAGALGWIDLGVVAVALVLFGGMLPGLDLRAARVVSVLAAASSAAYVLATLTESPATRVVFGAVTLLGMVAFLGWLGRRCPQIRLALPHLALLLAALALVLGTTIGVLLEVQAAGATTYFPGTTANAHPLVLDAGFLVLSAMALAEWRLRPAAGRWPPLGVAQIALAFTAAVALCLAALLAAPMLVPLAFAGELAAGVLFAARFARRVAQVPWFSRSGERLTALAGIFLVAYLAFLSYLLGKLVFHAYVSFAEIPGPLTTASDHLLFLGVMTNALFGVLFELTRAREGFWPVADELLFWGTNVGLLGFVTGVVARNVLFSLMLQGIFTPILGACLLVGAVAYSVRLQTARRLTSEPPRVGSTPQGRPRGWAPRRPSS